MNANQLASELDLDYKTVSHHLDLLVENDLIESVGDGYGDVYFLTDQMEQNLDVLEEIAATADVAKPNVPGGDADDSGGDSDV